MQRIAAAVAVGLMCAGAWGQVGAGSDTQNSLASNPPALNVRTIHNRAPGRIIEDALARHVERTKTRVAAQRARDTSVLLPVDDSEGFTSTGGFFGGLGNSLLQTLIGGALGGGGLSGSGSLGGLNIGNLVGGGSNAGSAGTSGNNLGNLPPEVLQMLEAFGIDPKDLNLKSNQDSDEKVDQQMQAITPPTEERKFIVRWADAMAQTFFAALTVGLQSQEFVDVLKDKLRPLFQMQDQADDTNSDAQGDSSSDSDTDGSSDSGTDDGSSDNPTI